MEPDDEGRDPSKGQMQAPKPLGRYAHDIDVEADGFAEYGVLTAATERFIRGPRRPPED